MTLKIWDVNMNSGPVDVIHIHDHLQASLKDLYESDCIFDEFRVALSPDGNHLATGSYENLFHVYDRCGQSDLCVRVDGENSSCMPRLRQDSQRSLDPADSWGTGFDFD